MLTTTPKSKSEPSVKRKSTNSSINSRCLKNNFPRKRNRTSNFIANQSTQSQDTTSKEPLLSNTQLTNITLDGEDERAVEMSIQLENCKKTIIDSYF